MSTIEAIKRLDRMIDGHKVNVNRYKIKMQSCIKDSNIEMANFYNNKLHQEKSYIKQLKTAKKLVLKEKAREL